MIFSDFLFFLLKTLIVFELVSISHYSSRRKMSVLSNMNILLMIVIVSILLVSGSMKKEQFQVDDMCKITENMLCVKDVLMIIATVAKSINHTANEIEKSIMKSVQTVDTLNRYVNFEMGLIHSHLPTSQYHVEFFQMNNIDKVF